MKLTGYTRVSTIGQVTDGLGLDDQETAIRKWARTEGHRIVVVRREPAVSGTADHLEDRLALGEALADVADGRSQGIVVWRLDRLARELVLQEQLLAEIRAAGGTPFSTSAAEAGYLTDDPDDPSRRLIRQILGAINEYDRAMIVLRLRRGRALKASRGGYAYGGPRYGWRAEGGELVPDPAEQAAIARAQELARAGRSLRTIGATLTAEGHRPRRGSRWHPNTVAGLLREPPAPAAAEAS